MATNPDSPRIDRADLHRFDAVVATYNAPPDRLARTVRSALASGASKVLIIDDGSVVPSDADLPEPGQGRVEVVRQENAGPASARNTGIERVDASLVVFIDDDDELIPDGVQEMAGLIARLGTGGAVGARIHVWPNGRVENRPVPPEWANAALPHPSHVLRPIGLFGASGCMVRRDVLTTGIRYDPGLRLGEDRDFLRRVAAQGGLAVCSSVVVRVSMHEGGENLSSPSHYARRIRDHLVLLDRWTDEVAMAHHREATRWLINASAKAGVDRASWVALVGAARARGWPVPLKARVRYALG